MYQIVYCGDTLHNRHVTILHDNIMSLATAKNLRLASGDLVIFQKTKEVVPSEAWLFDWEKKDPKSYAHRKVSGERVIGL